MTDKVYTRHTGYPGGQRFATPADYLAKKPTFIVEKQSRACCPAPVWAPRCSET